MANLRYFFGPVLICPPNRRTVPRLVRRSDSSQSAAGSSLWRSQRAVGHRPPLAHANIVVRVQRESVSRAWAALLSVRGSRVLLFSATVWTGTPFVRAWSLCRELHEFLFIHPPPSTLSWCFTSARRAPDSLDYILDRKQTSAQIHTSEITRGKDKMLWKLADNVKYEDDCEVRGRSEPKRAFHVQTSGWRADFIGELNTCIVCL